MFLDRRAAAVAGALLERGWSWSARRGWRKLPFPVPLAGLGGGRPATRRRRRRRSRAQRHSNLQQIDVFSSRSI